MSSRDVPVERLLDGGDGEDGEDYVGAGFTTIFSVKPRCT